MAFNTKNQIKSNQNLNKIRQRLYFITKGVTIPYLRLPGLCQKCGKLYESTYSTVLLDGYNMYSIQHYVNKFVSEFRPMVFSGTPVSFTNKTNRHDMTEILLKVALNTIKLTITLQNFLMLFTYLDFFERKNPEYCTLPEVFASSLNPGYLRSTYVFCKSWKLYAPAMCVNK